MNNDIRYATLERRPVRFNNREAWWVINGSWKAMHLAEAAFNARSLSKEEFEAWFMELPELPSTAFQAGDVIVPHIDDDLASMSGDQLYQRARSLPAGDPRIIAYIRQAQALYSEARQRLSPEWRAVLGG